MTNDTIGIWNSGYDGFFFIKEKELLDTIIKYVRMNKWIGTPDGCTLNKKACLNELDNIFDILLKANVLIEFAYNPITGLEINWNKIEENMLKEARKEFMNYE